MTRLFMRARPILVAMAAEQGQPSNESRRQR
jgi:hypothetical protein